MAHSEMPDSPKTVHFYNRQLAYVCFLTLHSLLVSGSDRVTEAKRVTINFVSKIHTNSIIMISTECTAMAIPNETSDYVT